MTEIFVENAYDNQSVLITGATGLIGKVLVEKLLRDCPTIKNVYILLRSKNGDGLQKRFESFKSSIIFNKLRKANGSSFDKLMVVEGDLMEPNLGMSQNDMKMLMENLTMIIHCAASARSDESIKEGLKMHTISTKNLLELTLKCNENFKGFVFVSTSYSNANQEIIHEKIYNPIINYKQFFELVENDDVSQLKILYEKALKTYSNPYILFKNLTESLVADYESFFPVAIVRPSIVFPSLKEPEVGWVDSYSGTMGLLVGNSSGVLRSIYGNGALTCDFIPCDYVANCTIVAGASIASSPTKSLEIYNCTSSHHFNKSWNEILDANHKYHALYPTLKILWYPSGRMHKNYYSYVLKYLYSQFIPACILDASAFLTGKKRWAIELQRKIFKSSNAFAFFLNRAWKWDAQNTEELLQRVSAEEREKFNFDVKKINFDKYFENSVIGMRKFLHKLDDSSIPEARRRYAFLFWLDFFIKIVFRIGLGYLLFKGFQNLLETVADI